MTAIAINKGFSTVQAIVDLFSRINKAMIMARGTEVNHKIAHQLQCEYKDMSVEEITHMLNQRLRQEVYGD